MSIVKTYHDAVAERVRAGMTTRAAAAEAAAELSAAAETVRGGYFAYRRVVGAGGNAPEIVVQRPSHSYPQAAPVRGSVATYDAHPIIEADRCLIVGDVHVPTTDWAFAARVAQVAKAQAVETLIIVGDLLNVDALSTHENITQPISLGAEMQAGRELIQHWLEVFPMGVWYIMGNHEERLARATKAALAWHELRETFSNAPHFHVTPYRHAELWTDGRHWRLTHQRNYSRNKLTVANKLALHYQTNVILHHQHHAAVGMSDNARHAIIDNGGLHDYRKMAYVMSADSTSPAMTNSFVFMDNGTAHLLTPYPQITDWGRWV